MSPATAVVDGIHELQQMGELAMNNLKMSMEALCEPDEKKIKEVCEQEAYIDFLNRQITDYLVKISELDLPDRGCKDPRRSVPCSQRYRADRRSCGEFCGSRKRADGKTDPIQ